MGRAKKIIQYNIKNILLFYNIITIIRHTLYKQDILYIDFIIDFVFFNICLVIGLIAINKLYKIFKVSEED